MKKRYVLLLLLYSINATTIIAIEKKSPSLALAEKAIKKVFRYSRQVGKIIGGTLLSYISVKSIFVLPKMKKNTAKIIQRQADILSGTAMDIKKFPGTKERVQLMQAASKDLQNFSDLFKQEWIGEIILPIISCGIGIMVTGEGIDGLVEEVNKEKQQNSRKASTTQDERNTI